MRLTGMISRPDFTFSGISARSFTLSSGIITLVMPARNAAMRALGRYNEKLRDAAKGLGLMANIYRDFAVAQGYDFESFWPYVAVEFFDRDVREPQ